MLYFTCFNNVINILSASDVLSIVLEAGIQKWRHPMESQLLLSLYSVGEKRWWITKKTVASYMDKCYTQNESH